MLLVVPFTSLYLIIGEWIFLTGSLESLSIALYLGFFFLSRPGVIYELTDEKFVLSYFFIFPHKFVSHRITFCTTCLLLQQWPLNCTNSSQLVSIIVSSFLYCSVLGIQLIFSADPNNWVYVSQIFLLFSVSDFVNFNCLFKSLFWEKAFVTHIARI